MKTAKLIALWLCVSVYGYAQELNCVVQVNASQVQGTDKRIFETLQSSMFEFMNGRRWTNLSVSPQERIECSFTLVVQRRDPKTNEIAGSLSVQVRRPVYNSTYNSVLLNFMDKDISFTYAEYDPLEYSDGTINGNLTATLAYYAYIAIGLTFDSFGKEAGMSLFDRAMEIVMQCQDFPAVEAGGWKSSSKNTSNRYWLAENLTNGNFRDIHDIYYTYYRKGLDEMYKSPEAARQAILQCLDKMQKLNKSKPNLLCKTAFFEAKSEELINIFKMGTADEKNKLITLMRDLDPTGLNNYQTIQN